MNFVSHRLLISSRSAPLIWRSLAVAVAKPRAYSSAYEKKLLLWRKDRLEAELIHVNKYLGCFPTEEEEGNKAGDSSHDEATPRASGPWTPKTKGGSGKSNGGGNDQSPTNEEYQDFLASMFDDLHVDIEYDEVYWTDGVAISRTWKDGKWFYEC